MAPIPGSAQGTTEPTARNFDCVATPQWRAARSQAAIEYVATSFSAIGELGQVDVEQGAVVDERAGDLGSRERRFHLGGARRADHDRPAYRVSGAKRVIVDRVEHQGSDEVELAVERNLRNAPARRAGTAVPPNVNQA